MHDEVTGPAAPRLSQSFSKKPHWTEIWRTSVCERAKEREANKVTQGSPKNEWLGHEHRDPGVRASSREKQGPARESFGSS